MSTDDKRPKNASAKIVHERFVVSVDGQMKMSFASQQDAQRESDRITGQYPRVVVHVLDSDRPLVRETPDSPEQAARRKRVAQENAANEAAAQDAASEEADAPADEA